jgi:hypothetical protein
LSSCGGKEFVSTPDSGGSSSSGKGGSNSAGKDAGGSDSGATGGTNGGGDVASGGAPDPGGSAGTGGMITTSCDCPAGHYCRDGSVDCFDCAELNRLHFTPPERLATLSDNGQDSKYPRVGTSATDLVYTFSGIGMRYTTDSSTSAGSSVKGTMPPDSGPLLLSESITGVGPQAAGSFNFVFDRVVEGTRRQLFGGQWTNGLQLSAQLPPPYNTTTGNGDYSMAIALHPNGTGAARAYWMAQHDANAAPSLVTALFEATVMTGAVVNLAVGAPDCKPSSDDLDLAPWVTSDGKTLLFSHTRIDAKCQPSGQGKDLYTTLLQPADGQPPTGTAALPMYDVNSAADDVQPSFSADLCDLYFASNRDGKYAVYRAHRR